MKKDIVTLGFVKDLAISGGDVSFRIVLTTPACPVKEAFETEAKKLVGEIEGVENVNVTMDAEVPQGRGIANNIALPGVKNIIAVSSGKGGVGKSTVAVNLAVSLSLNGAKVGLMDADVYGPNVPMMLGIKQNQPDVENGKLIPIQAHGVKVISMAVLVPPDKPMILRGPMLHGVVRQFLTDVDWGELDYLIVDMPPGTGDVQLSLAQLVPVQGAILVTTPQAVSLSDVRRALAMFETVSIPVLGVVENMSYFVPPDMPEKRYNIFGEGGGRKFAEQFNLPFLRRSSARLGSPRRRRQRNSRRHLESRFTASAGVSHISRRSRPLYFHRSDETGTRDFFESKIIYVLGDKKIRKGRRENSREFFADRRRFRQQTDSFSVSLDLYYWKCNSLAYCSFDTECRL